MEFEPSTSNLGRFPLTPSGNLTRSEYIYLPSFLDHSRLAIYCRSFSLAPQELRENKLDNTRKFIAQRREPTLLIRMCLDEPSRVHGRDHDVSVRIIGSRPGSDHGE